MVVGKKIRVDGKRVLSGWLISYFAIIQRVLRTGTCDKMYAEGVNPSTQLSCQNGTRQPPLA